MYALHDASLTATVLPVSQPNIASADQLERRAVESSEHGSLETKEHPNRLYNPAAAVLELVEGSAQRLAEMLEADVSDGAEEAAPGLNPGSGAGPEVDVYA
jgi:hypothetical protein